ncbi:MAG TPA: DNA ligase D [Candidatus Dormibacteraeota bacterium]|nr:DNA ligase D [Candidatus Dormibacteraeota bacterium]
MPLDEYRRKRDFASTPEPRGGDAVAVAEAQPALGFPGWSALPAGHRFCVQMHRATRLHFDLRLEHSGVLLSWAVPRGPTLDPAEKRLAVHVEDHPIEYGEFEGVIPSGYGAGTVMLWDAGTFRWERESAADADASLRKGDVKFSLDGVKLHGEFALIRTGGRRRGSAAPVLGSDEEKSWLLIKKRDDAVVPGMNASDLDWSVKSGRSLAQIRLGEAPRSSFAVAGDGADGASVTDGLRRIIESSPEAALPTRLAPMQAMSVDAPFTRQGWVFEMKYDGVRALATKSRGRVSLRGRKGRDETGRYPEVAALASALRLDEALVDGELVSLDEGGHPSFERLQQRINLGDVRQVERAIARVPVTYVIFDLLAANGHDLRQLPLVERKRALRLALRDTAEVRYADHVETDGEALFAAIRQQELEGMVAKRASSVYEAGRRSGAWLKVKAWNEQDCVVCGYTGGRGGRGALGALILGVYVDATLTHAGQVGSGLSGATAKALLARLGELRAGDSPLSPAPVTDQPATWVRPELVCTVRYADWTSAGTLRHPTYRGIRDDVDPRDCVRDIPVTVSSAIAADPPAPPPMPATATAARMSRSRQQRPQPGIRDGDDRAVLPDTTEALEQLVGMQRDGPWDIAGRTLRLTNLDKLLWPEGITKRDMIAYYVRMAPLLLPHLRDRPLGMQVFPDGIEGKHFWRKRIPDHAPKWMRSWEWRGDRAVTYIVVEEVATLAWLANSAVIDLHPWHSRIDAPEQPDWAVFDLDPFPPATFADVVLIARLVKSALDHYALRSVAKVSGQTGLQIYVPLRRGPDYARVRGWVEEVSRAIGRVVPDKVSWEWEVARRTGRLRLDYTQNVLGKTLAAPYSLRPAPGAPVSTPIAWEELDESALRPDAWTIHTIENRVRTIGDLFATALDGDQDLPEA